MPDTVGFLTEVGTNVLDDEIFMFSNGLLLPAFDPEVAETKEPPNLELVPEAGSGI